MLRNKRVRVIISLVVAILLWAYVVGDVNPSVSKTIRNLPITLLHSDVLAERNLAVSNMTQETVDVEITGSRAVINEITADDIKAYVDMAYASKGENDMVIQFGFGMFNGLTVKSQSITNTSVMVEDMVQKDVDVVISYSGTFSEDEEGTILSMSSEQITVSGAVTLVELVEKVTGVVDASRLSDVEASITCQLSPVNAAGDNVRNINLSQDQISVKAVRSKLKEVKLYVHVLDNSSDGAKRTTSHPEEVIITGTVAALKNVTHINAEDVDISNMADSRAIDLKFQLPEGIRISDRNEDLTLKVEVSSTAERSFTFTPDEITLVERSDDYSYALAKDVTIKVTVVDTPAVINELSKNDITLSVYVGEMTTGTTKASIEAKCTTKLTNIVVEPVAITVTVSKSAG